MITAVIIRQWKACLEHAENLVVSAERVLGNDDSFPNIAFHLALLAMEEIGKAQLIIAGAVSHKLNYSWATKRLEDHVFKLMWAIWSPTVLNGPINPKKFEEANKTAKNLHSKRLDGLYVNHDKSVGDDAAPSSAVSVADAHSILKMACLALRLEKDRDISEAGLPNENLDWFLERVSDEQGQRLLFSKPFIQKLEEIGEPVEWIEWARAEFDRVLAEELDVIAKERARSKSDQDSIEPRWILHIRLNSRWHAIRQKSLNLWNQHITFAQFEKPKEFQENELLLRLTLYDNIKIDDVFDAGLMWSKLILVCLNVGTGGFVWYQVSGSQDCYFDKIKDLKKPDMSLKIGKPSGLSSLTVELSGEKGERHKDTLTEPYMRVAIKCFYAFSRMSEREAEPIFAPYIYALTLLSKSDLHLSCEYTAKQSFFECLAAVMKQFGRWDGADETLTDALNSYLSEVIPLQNHRDKIIENIDLARDSNEKPIVQAFHMKRLVDLCLSLAAHQKLQKYEKISGKK